MNYLLVLLLGIAIGWLLALFWLSITTQWKSSRNLNSSYDKAVKEIAEKNKKAREDRRKARSAAVRAVLQAIFFVLAVFLMVALVFNLIN
jgi:hypothetical protein